MTSNVTRDTLAKSIRLRYEQTLEQIEAAAKRAGRLPDSVRLLVVSKSQPMEVIQAALAAGIRLFGENYVEEAVEKVAAVKESGVEWHMIGHVQSRKADLVAANFAMVHSVDGLKLARRLDRACGELKRTLPILLELNVSGEESKFGLPAWDEAHWPDLLAELEPLTALANVKVRGLMTMPPYFLETERARPYFQKLRRLQVYLQAKLPQAEWNELSMGTSVDFPIAVEEGATYVRIGEAILGPRPKKREL